MTDIKVLYLDDELNNLVAFKAGFRSLFTVFTANNVMEALQLLNTHEIHVIISDQRMPDMTGVEFFEHILLKHPDPVRILLTGYSDIGDVIKAINKGQIFRYIEKPWDQHRIIEAVEGGYKHYWVSHQLKLKNQELEKMNEELSRFVYSASHDLKAPVKTMLGLLFLSNDLTQEKDETLVRVVKSIRQLDNVINSITDFYKNHNFTVNLSRIDFRLLLEEAVISVKNSLSTPFDDVDLQFEITEDQPFVSDSFRVALVLNNLLSNAIKYQKLDNKDKRVIVQIISDRRGVKISMEDNGIGIADMYKDKIYNMFYRASTQNTGSGIGLYIAKETVEKLNGTILLETKEGLGSKFEITLPNMA